MNKQIISLVLRLVTAMNFLFVAIAHLKLWKFYTEEETKITSWITSNSIIGNSIAVLLFVISLFLLVGYKTFWATLTAIGILLVNHIALLFTKPSVDPFCGPFYNSFHHSVPFIGFLIIILYSLSTEQDFSIDRIIKQKENKMTKETKNEIVHFIARIFIGTIFFAQGLHILLGEGSFIAFAENVYVKSYETSFIPKFLLWTMGIINPWILCLGGILLVIGFKTKWISFILAFFMVSIVFGHLIGDPFETTGDISMFGFNNLAFIILIIWLENGQKKYSIERLWN